MYDSNFPDEKIKHQGSKYCRLCIDINHSIILEPSLCLKDNFKLDKGFPEGKDGPFQFHIRRSKFKGQTTQDS